MMTRQSRPCCLSHLLRPLLATSLLGVLATEAAAYVPSTITYRDDESGEWVDTGIPLLWHGSNCVYLRVSSKGTKDIKDGSDVVAVKRSADNWREATKHCSYLRFVFLPDSADATPGFNERGANENVIFWHDSTWPAEYDRFAAAITTVTYARRPGHPEDGRILDADIELNGATFLFSTTSGPQRTDIENTVTHELGHIVGLDHPCDDGMRRPVPKDHTGATIPRCNSATLPAWIRETTMYNFAESGETKKRSPEADDILGFCQSYPLASDPGVCMIPSPLDTGDDGCAVAGGGPAGVSAAGSGRRAAGLASLAAILLLAAGLVLAGMRRRRLRPGA